MTLESCNTVHVTHVWTGDSPHWNILFHADIVLFHMEPELYEMFPTTQYWIIFCIQARSQGGGGRTGRTTPYFELATGLVYIMRDYSAYACVDVDCRCLLCWSVATKSLSKASVICYVIITSISHQSTQSSLVQWHCVSRRPHIQQSTPRAIKTNVPLNFWL